MLYGRGAADMKASLAAFVTAAEAFVAAQPAHGGSLAFLLTSDEEGDAVDGTVVVTDALQRRGELLDYCIVGEPTAVRRLGDMVKNGRRGSLSGRLTVKGIQGHIAYPHLAKNPIHLVAPAIADSGRHRLGRWQRLLSANHLANLEHPRRHRRQQRHPRQCRSSISTSASAPPAPRSNCRRRLCDILDRAGLDYDIAWTLGARPFLTGRGALIDAALQAIAAETGIEAELSTTAAPRTVASSPTSVRRSSRLARSTPASTRSTSASLADLPQLAAIYRRIIEQLLPGHV
jgi:succinyl-diaminopimelate desuccinylase